MYDLLLLIVWLLGRSVVGLIPDVKVDVNLTPNNKHHLSENAEFGIFVYNWDVTSWRVTASLNTYGAFRCTLQTVFTCFSAMILNDTLQLFSEASSHTATGGCVCVCVCVCMRGKGRLLI